MNASQKSGLLGQDFDGLPRVLKLEDSLGGNCHLGAGFVAVFTLGPAAIAQLVTAHPSREARCRLRCKLAGRILSEL